MSEQAYRVVVEKGWSYVVGEPAPEHSGPWRYQWEAQEYADELNGLGELTPGPGQCLPPQKLET